MEPYFLCDDSSPSFHYVPPNWKIGRHTNRYFFSTLGRIHAPGAVKRLGGGLHSQNPAHFMCWQAMLALKIGIPTFKCFDYKKYFARTKKGTMTKPDFLSWETESEWLRDKALAEYDRAKTEDEKTAIVERLWEELNRQ